MNLDYPLIGSRIKEARLAKNITQEELAAQIDISVAFLSRIERGSTHINLKRLSQICNLLEIPEGYVLNGSSSESDNYLTPEFSHLLKSTNPQTRKLIYNIAKLIIENEEENY